MTTNINSFFDNHTTLQNYNQKIKTSEIQEEDTDIIILDDIDDFGEVYPDIKNIEKNSSEKKKNFPENINEKQTKAVQEKNNFDYLKKNPESQNNKNLQKIKLENSKVSNNIDNLFSNFKNSSLFNSNLNSNSNNYNLSTNKPKLKDLPNYTTETEEKFNSMNINYKFQQNSTVLQENKINIEYKNTNKPNNINNNINNKSSNKDLTNLNGNTNKNPAFIIGKFEQENNKNNSNINSYCQNLQNKNFNYNNVNNINNMNNNYKVNSEYSQGGNYSTNNKQNNFCSNNNYNNNKFIIHDVSKEQNFNNNNNFNNNKFESNPEKEVILNYDKITSQKVKSSSVKEYSFKEELNPKYKNNQEDYIKIIDNFTDNPKIGLFSLYDGHGGEDPVKYVKDRMPEILAKFLKNSNDTIDNCLISAFDKIDNELKFYDSENTGTTATVVVISGKTLFLANVGDSRCILINNSETKILSYDHKCTDLKEVERIKNSGGMIFNNRVFGQLALTRALGDHAIKKYGVVSTPFINKIELKESDKYIIIASDGVWDVITEEYIKELALKFVNTEEICENVIQQSLVKGSKDNISCIVIKL